MASPKTKSPNVQISKKYDIERPSLIKGKTSIEKSPLKLLNFDSMKDKTKRTILNKIRLHYFFTEKDADLIDFMKETQIELRITDGVNWNKPIATAV